MEKVIDITAKRAGFRRAGMQHSDTTQTYPLDTFTAAQIKELQSEPMLVVAIRNANETGVAQDSQQDAFKLRILELEGAVLALNDDLAAERQKLSDLASELEAERQAVADLTAQLETARQASDAAAQQAAEKKGK